MQVTVSGNRLNLKVVHSSWFPSHWRHLFWQVATATGQDDASLCTKISMGPQLNKTFPQCLHCRHSILYTVRDSFTSLTASVNDNVSLPNVVYWVMQCISISSLTLSVLRRIRESPDLKSKQRWKLSNFHWLLTLFLLCFHQFIVALHACSLKSSQISLKLVTHFALFLIYWTRL